MGNWSRVFLPKTWVIRPPPTSRQENGYPDSRYGLGGGSKIGFFFGDMNFLNLQSCCLDKLKTAKSCEISIFAIFRRFNADLHASRYPKNRLKIGGFTPILRNHIEVPRGVPSRFQLYSRPVWTQLRPWLRSQPDSRFLFDFSAIWSWAISHPISQPANFKLL